jgi:hypothetical protein
MGMEQTVTFPAARMPAWPAVRDLLAQRGLAVLARMIDGQLAFPDEEPSPTWHELRVGTAQGMVTVRREPDQVRLVVWGNADAGLRQLWNTLTWAYAEAGSGQIITGEGSFTAAEYRRQAELPDGLR